MSTYLKKLDLKNHLNTPLYKNSYYLMANTVLTAGSGFFFWIFATWYYTVEEVGLGTAIMSVAWLISVISLLGLDIGLIRFLPNEKDKSKMINSCYSVTAFLAFLFSIIFISGLYIWTPRLAILQEQIAYGVVFVLLTIALTLFGLQANVFIAFRQAKYSSFQASVSMLRVLLLPFLASFGAYGIYLSSGLGAAIALLVGNLFIGKVFRDYRPTILIEKKMIDNMMRYSLGNYFANIFYFLPVAILPLFVLQFLGEEMNAYFGVAWAISSILLMIPFSISTSLFVEGTFSRNELGLNIKRSLKFISVLIIFAIIGIFILGKYVLLLFGEIYAVNAFDLLLILSVASIPHSVNVVYVAVMRVEQKVMQVIYVYGGIAFLTLAGSYFSIHAMGLMGIGVSWILANVIVALITGTKMIQNITDSRGSK